MPSPRYLVVASALLLCRLAAVPASADQSGPVIRINDPFAAPIWRMDVDGAQSTIVTGSMAKAVTLWPADDLKDFKIDRVPLRDEEMQRAHAVAISPDGRLIAYSVPPLRKADGQAEIGTARIYILDRSGGHIRTTISADLETRAQALRFSPDGTHLAATLSDGCGLRIWRTSDWTLAGRDDSGFAANDGINCCPGPDAIACDPAPTTPGLAFSPIPGRTLVATSGDAGVKLFELSRNGLSRVAYAGPEKIGLELPEDVAFNADGSRIAVGDARRRTAGSPVKPQAALLDARTLAPLGAPLAIGDHDVISPALLDPTQTPSAQQLSLNRVAWVEDEGETSIVAGGVLWCQALEPSRIKGQLEDRALDNCLVRWRVDPRTGRALAPPDFIRAGLDRAMDLRFLAKSRRLAVATLERLVLLNLDGSRAEAGGEPLVSRSRAIDFRDRPVDKSSGTWLGFAASADLTRVYVEDFRSSKTKPLGLLFDVATLKVAPAALPPDGLSPPNRDPFVIEDIAQWWNQRQPPTLYGLPLDEVRQEKDTYRFAVLGDGQWALIGSANHLRLVDYSGGAAKVVCDRRISAEAFRGALAADGTLAVVGHGDGTLVWYRIDRAATPCRLDPVLTIHIRRAESGAGWTWTAWQPTTGKFAADGRNQRLLTWQVAKPDGGFDLVLFSMLRTLYDPAAIKASLATPLPSADQVAALEKGVREAADPVRLSVVYPDPAAEVAEPTVSFDLRPEGAGPWPQHLWVTVGGGGSPAAKRAAGRSYTASEPVEVATAAPLTVDVELPESARRSNGNLPVCFHFDGAAEETCHTITWIGPLTEPPPRRLWAVIVGFSAYRDPALALPFAQNDALDIAHLFIDDYEQRVRKSGPKADFADLHVDLLVAAASETAAAELRALEANDRVTIRSPSTAGLREALRAIAAEDKDGALADDVVLFYFSGHGLLHPYNRDKGLTALLDPEIEPSYSFDSLARHAIASDELIGFLDGISAAKLVIIDACRTTAAIPEGRAFDPGAVSLEFESRLVSANVFFSAAPGQPSLDQNLYAFDATRPEDVRGNGLFTFALLRSLTTKQAGKPRTVRPFDVEEDIGRFFDRADPDSAAQKLLAMLAEQGITVAMQEPIFMPARRQGIRNMTIRTVLP
jgi:WD40 repeat protein